MVGRINLHNLFDIRDDILKKLLALLLLSPMAYSAEKDLNKLWCSSVNWDNEFRTKDGTYVDCITKDFAVEAEYDYKWKY